MNGSPLSIPHVLPQVQSIKKTKPRVHHQLTPGLAVVAPCPLPSRLAAQRLLAPRSALSAARAVGAAFSSEATGGSASQLEPYLEQLLGQPEAAQELLAKHPELPQRVTPEEAQRSVDALLAAPLSRKTVAALVRSCPRLLWRGPELALRLTGDGTHPPAPELLHKQGDAPEPSYQGYWVPDYNPVHDSVTGVPAVWVGGPKPPLDQFTGRLLELTKLAYSLPASDGEGEWSDEDS